MPSGPTSGAPSGAPPRAIVFGCAGTALSDWERDFFADSDPLGFILFKRNCETPEQIRALVGDLRDSVGRADALLLIDQEGGRVERLKPPHWPSQPAAGEIGALAESDPAVAEEAAGLQARLIAHNLHSLGITVDCAPVLDLRHSGASDVVGDRAFGGDPATVARLGRAFCDGLLAGGVLPVVKHLPGHGRALCDSHHALPVIEAEIRELERSDFLPFQALADMPMAMTAHICLPAIDGMTPATASAPILRQVIREFIGFQGLLFSDDLSMSALAGDLGERTAACLAAGCDVALHCNGDSAEMALAAAAAGPLSEAGMRRLEAALQRLVWAPEPIDSAALRARLDALLRAH